jgi:hypothetical protein
LYWKRLWRIWTRSCPKSSPLEVPSSGAGQSTAPRPLGAQVRPLAPKLDQRISHQGTRRNTNEEQSSFVFLRMHA